jgi:hypothetical protein
MGAEMIAYKLYWRDEEEKEHFIGLLPERRRNPKRITDESLANWSRIVLGDKTGIDLNSIYFIQLEL